MKTYGTFTGADIAAEIARNPGHTAADNFLTAASLVGRNHGPALLFDWWKDGHLTPGDMAAIVAFVWSGADGSRRSLSTELWVNFFKMAGYQKPDNPLRLYRGATPHFARGMSWTDDPIVARWFADRFATFAGSGPFKAAYVYTIVAPPEAILWDSTNPIFQDVGRPNEREIVVDPRLIPKTRRLQ